VPPARFGVDLRFHLLQIIWSTSRRRALSSASRLGFGPIVFPYISPLNAPMKRLHAVAAMVGSLSVYVIFRYSLRKRFVHLQVGGEIVRSSGRGCFLAADLSKSVAAWQLESCRGWT